jgi:hypothetical protein
LAERVIIWVLFGVTLSLTPLLIVAAIGWVPATGVNGFATLLCNEEILAVALTLGGAAAADVLTSSDPFLRLVKLSVGGITFLATIACMALYVLLKTHTSHLGPSQAVTAVLTAGGFTIVCALCCEVLSGAKR